MTPTDNTEAIGRAYRTASTELPPPETDAALRAAARRAVVAGPKRARHMRNWPLAAAAVVAMLAIGILQMTPPEEVTPGEVATSAPSGARLRESTTLAQAPVDTNKDAALAPSAQPQPAPPDNQRSLADSLRKEASTDSLSSVTPVAKVKQESRQAAAPARPAAVASSSPSPAPTPAADSAASTRMQSPAQAFPAEPARRDADREKLDAAAMAENRAKLSSQLANAPSDERARAAGAAAPSAAPASTEEKKLAAAPAPASAPAAADAAKPTAPAPAMMMARKSVAENAASPASETAAPAAAGAVAKDAIKPPGEWIKLIRQLRSEGKIDASNRELAAFRAAYRDRADALLPADLRAIKP
jgi:hypothetical protein